MVIRPNDARAGEELARGAHAREPSPPRERESRALTSPCAVKGGGEKGRKEEIWKRGRERG